MIGGDSGLSERGRDYASRLGAFVSKRIPEGCAVWTSALQRTRQTAAPLEELGTFVGCVGRATAGCRFILPSAFMNHES